MYSTCALHPGALELYPLGTRDGGASTRRGACRWSGRGSGEASWRQGRQRTDIEGTKVLACAHFGGSEWGWASPCHVGVVSTVQHAGSLRFGTGKSNSARLSLGYAGSTVTRVGGRGPPRGQPVAGRPPRHRGNTGAAGSPPEGSTTNDFHKRRVLHAHRGKDICTVRRWNRSTRCPRLTREPFCEKRTAQVWLACT